MSLKDKADSYLSKILKAIIFFAVLGCIILWWASNYLTKTLMDAAGGVSQPVQPSSQSTPGH